MTAPHILNPAALLEKGLSEASPDLMRHLLTVVINALLSADADAVCGAEYGVASPDRVNSRNGYRHRDLDTRAGTIDVAIPKLRTGTYFPEWLLERRKRAEAALISVVATCYLLGVSTRRMDKLVQSLGIDGLSKSQVSRMAADLDEQVTAFRTRPLAEAGPFVFVAADALTMKVREHGRVVNAVVLVATGVNADGHREVLGVKVATSETKQAWNTFFADLVARGLGGVTLVTSDAHAGLVEAIAANLPGATWQRCRTHYAANLMSVCPKSAWPAVKAMLHSVYDQVDARPHAGAQLRITDIDGHRVTAFATNTRPGGPGTQLADLELRHRRRARAEDRIRIAKDTGLRNLPLHGFDQNRIWCAVVALAVEITAWMQLLAMHDSDARRWEPKRLRLRLFAIPATLARTGRRILLHLSARAPWADVLTTAITRLRALAEPG